MQCIRSHLMGNVTGIGKFVKHGPSIITPLQEGSVDCGLFAVMAMDFLGTLPLEAFPTARKVKEDEAAAAQLALPYPPWADHIDIIREALCLRICDSTWYSQSAGECGALGQPWPESSG